MSSSSLSTHASLPLGPYSTPEIVASRPDVDLAVLERGFFAMQSDPYCAGGYRWRAASRFANGDAVRKLPNVPLYQSPVYNPLQGYGGVSRNYPDIDAATVVSDAFNGLIRAWLATVPEPIPTFSVHQIRTTAPGAPVPEGKHRDGNDWVGIYVVARERLVPSCGVTTVWDRSDRELICRVIQPGELLSFDDRLTFHDTTAIAAVDRHPAWRDVFVFSAPDHEHYLKDAPAT